ncbi:MAG: pilus assembly protein PilM [Candidatus Gygaella obscura]|nr:pilus assembly protein PilM [Candidatus Gygaella obscura]
MAKQTKKIIGLDIGNTCIKVCKASFTEGFVLQSCKMLTLSKGNKLNLDMIKNLTGEKDLTNFKIITSLQGQGIVIRYLILPKISKQELKSALRFELEKNIPFSIDDVITDGQVIKEFEDKMLVLAVAAKKNFLFDHIDYLSKIGINPIVVDITSLALANSFNFAGLKDKSNVCALLNMGSNFTNLTILRDEVPYFNRDIQIGASQLDKKVADNFSVGIEQAEKMRINPVEKGDDIHKSYESIIEDLISEVKFSFDYFENKEDAGIQEIYLSGGLSQSDFVREMLKKALNLDCKLWDPIASFNKASDFEIDSRFGNSIYSTSIGLVLRGQDD